jgi:hypothetical protein
MRFSPSGRSPFPLLHFGSWCLSSLECDISLCSSHCVLFAMPSDSQLLLSSLIAVLAAQLGTPRGRYDEHSGKFSLSMKPRFNRPVGERNHF